MEKDLIIIGNGPAGLSAAIYAVRAGYQVLVLSDNPMPGGQIAMTYEVENYPGIMDVSGAELGQRFLNHAVAQGVEFATETVSSIEDSGYLKTVVTNKNRYQTQGVVIATGATHKRLGVIGEEEFIGQGVSYCATCDGAFFKNRMVAVVGGGDVALEDAIFLSRFAAKVYLIHRRKEFRGAAVLQEQVRKIDKIEIIYDSVIDEIQGQDMVETVLLRNVVTEEQTLLPVNGVFMAVGILPNIGGIQGLPKQDPAGYVIAKEDCVTSIPGIFVAGDVRTKQLRQVVTAAADGANAITSFSQYLQGNISG